MSDRAQVLAERLTDIDADIESAKDAMREALSASEYQDALDAKVAFLADRQVVVEQLEEIGLEDPDL